MMTSPAQTNDLALVESRVMLALTRIEGDVRLVLQRLEQQDRRVSELADQNNRLDARLDAVERDQVTRAQLDERSRRTIAILGLISTFVSILVGAGVTTIIAIVN